MKLFSKACIALALFVLVGCGGSGGEGSGKMEADSTSSAKTVVHSGTITKVNADEKKITVDVKDGETMEFTFGDSTKVLHRYKEVPFDSLRADRQVGVEVKKGSSTPITVNIAK